MKELCCCNCHRKWIIYSEDLNYNKVCPFCLHEIKCKASFEKIETFEQLIFKTVELQGTDVFNSPKRMNGIMMDFSSKFLKEINIFFKMSDKEFKLLKEVFDGEFYEAEEKLLRLKQMLVDIEGLAESWAEFIREKNRRAFILYKGFDEKCCSWNVSIQDFALCKNEQNKIFVGEKEDNDNNSDNDDIIVGYHVFSFLNGRRINIPHVFDSDLFKYIDAYELEKAGKTDDAITLYQELTRFRSKNCLPAYVRLAMLHEKLNHNKAAWRTLFWGAENGDAECAYWVGKYYWIGKIVKKSRTNAIKYFVIAAEQGVCEANIALSYIYKDNKSLSENYLNAANYSLSCNSSFYKGENNEAILQLLRKNIEQWL